MKKKRKLTTFLIGIMLLLVMTGCEQQYNAFCQRVRRVKEWKQIEVEHTSTLKCSEAGIVSEYEGNGVGWIQPEEQRGGYKGVVNTKTQNETEQPILTLDLYSDSKITYMNKEGLVELLGIAGKTNCANVKNIKSKYIGISGLSVTAFMDKLCKKPDLIESLGFRIPLKRNQNKFTIAMNEVNLFSNLQSVALELNSNAKKYNTLFEWGMEDKELAQVFPFNKEQLTTEFEKYRGQFKGNLLVNIEFAEEFLVVKGSLKGELKGGKNLEYEWETTYKKAQNTIIIPPFDTIVFRVKELPTLFSQNVLMFHNNTKKLETLDGHLYDAEMLIEEGKRYVPLKLVLGLMGREIKYDPQNKQTYYLKGDRPIIVFKKVKNNVSYINEEELTRLGFSCIYDENQDVMVIIEPK